jgi:hypothetical protein
MHIQIWLGPHCVTGSYPSVPWGGGVFSLAQGHSQPSMVFPARILIPGTPPHYKPADQ